MGKTHAMLRCLVAGALVVGMFGFTGVGYAEEGEMSQEAAIEKTEAEQGEDTGERLDGAEVDTATDAVEGSAAVAETEQDALAAPLALSAAEGDAADAIKEASFAQPAPSDYDFSQGVIKGLKKAYVNGLTAEQKKDVRLVIPGEIDGMAVTSIADKAFYTGSGVNAGCTFTYVDLSQALSLRSIGSSSFMGAASAGGTVDFSQMTSLQSIGSQAFNGAKGLKGDLYLPDSLISLGDSAFMGSGFDGELRIPNNETLTKVPDQVFKGTPLTGTLTVPSSIVSIGKSAFAGTAFAGELVIPEGVQELWLYAFSGCKGITSVSIPSTMDFKTSDTLNAGQQFQDCTSLERVTFAPNSQMKELQRQTFGNCPKLKVLELPEGIERMSARSIYSCNSLQTVYLPSAARIVDASTEGSLFFGSGGAVVVCSDKTSYDAYKAQLKASMQKSLTYPVEVSFNAGSYGMAPEPIEKLFNRKMNMVRDGETSIWAAQSDFTWPVPGGADQPSPGFEFTWSFDASGTQKASVSGTVTSGQDFVLYARGLEVQEPLVSFDFPWAIGNSSIAGKVYDGEDLVLSVKANHALAVDPTKAKIGDYVFAYRWMLYDSSTGKAAIKKQGFDNTFSLRDVADSQLGPTKKYLTYVYFYKVTTTTGVPDFSGKVVAQRLYCVDIQAATPTVHPTLAVGESNLEGFPALALAQGDTPGTVTWDQGQTLIEGVHSYRWTFAPDAPAVGKVPNYKTSAGTIELRVAGGKVVQAISFDTVGGDAMEAIDVAYGATLPEGLVPTKEGSVFLGWYKDEACTQRWDAATPVSGDVTLHARWGARSAGIDVGSGSFVVNGEAVDASSHTVEVNRTDGVSDADKAKLQAAALPEGACEQGMCFGLGLVVDGSEFEQASFDHPVSISVDFEPAARTRYRVVHLKADGSTEVLDATPDLEAHSLTFSAGSLGSFMVVSQKLFDVTFDSAGGSKVEAAKDVPAGTRLAAAPVPTKEGYVFLGWYEDEACTQAWDATKPIACDLSLHARWTERSAQIDPGEGELVVNGETIDQGSHVVEIHHEASIAPEAQEVLQTVDLPAGQFEQEGFFELNVVLDGAVAGGSMFSKPVTVSVSYPVVERTNYQVAHLRHDGTVELIAAQADCEAKTLSFPVDSLSPFMVVSQRLFDVAFDSAGGSEVTTVLDVPAGMAVKAPDDPSREGFIFSGWYRDAALTQPWDFSKDVVADDMTLYAAWTAVDPDPDPEAPPIDPVDPGYPAIDQPGDTGGKAPADDGAGAGTAANPAGKEGVARLLPTMGDDAPVAVLLGATIVAGLAAGAAYRVRRRPR